MPRPLRPRDLILDNHNCPGIVIRLADKPDPGWIRMQRDTRVRDLGDCAWWKVIPLDGGSILVPEPLVRFQREATPEDVRAALSEANAAGAETILNLFPELRDAAPRTRQATPVPRSSPPSDIDSPAAPGVRPPREAARRLLVLASVCAVAADDAFRGTVVPWLRREGLWSAVSPSERRFLEADHSSRKDEIDNSWLAEAVHVPGWALQLETRLAPLSAQASTGAILDRIPAPGEPIEAFLRGAALRPATELQAAADDLQRAHVECQIATREKRAKQRGNDIEVVQERQRAITWLVQDDGSGWDEVAIEA